MRKIFVKTYLGQSVFWRNNKVCKIIIRYSSENNSTIITDKAYDKGIKYTKDSLRSIL